MRPQATRVIHLQARCFMLLKFYIRIINCNWRFFFSAIFVTWCICAAATTAGLKTCQYIRDSQIVQSEMLEKISLSGKKIFFFFLFLYQCSLNGDTSYKRILQQRCNGKHKQKWPFDYVTSIAWSNWHCGYTEAFHGWLNWNRAATSQWILQMLSQKIQY